METEKPRGRMHPWLDIERNYLARSNSLRYYPSQVHPLHDCRYSSVAWSTSLKDRLRFLAMTRNSSANLNYSGSSGNVKSRCQVPRYSNVE